jgi:hypothetical protein
MSLHIPSDTITFSSISTGGNSAGNGGAGVNTGNITDNAHIDFNPTNYAIGADVYVHNGDHVTQNANGGIADLSHGADTSTVHADTTAYQTNFLAADMSQTVLAGVGGNGGDGNYAVGGDVHVHA